MATAPRPQEAGLPLKTDLTGLIPRHPTGSGPRVGRPAPGVQLLIHDPPDPAVHTDQTGKVAGVLLIVR